MPDTGRMPPGVRRFPALEPLSRAAADWFVDEARAAVQARGVCTVALTGGTTPRRTYELLAAERRRAEVPWDRLQLFWGDERAVPPDDERSNFRLARDTLLAPLGIPASQIHRLEGERADLDAAAAAYARTLAAVFAIPPDGPPPAFDLLLLGLGADGHTASLFPHAPALGERHRWVVAQHVPALDTDRLTLTMPVLNAARSTAVLVAGVHKAAALAGVLDGPPDPERLPAQRIARTSGRLVWLVDEAAASQLRHAGAGGHAG